jgi:predicted RNA methylase
VIDFEVIRAAVRDGSLDADERLDGLYPPEFTRFRGQHTTPVEVSARAAAWLAPDASSRVLDVGCGAGRFCLTGALTTRGHFTGVEQRSWLVEAAREAASKLDVTRADFVCGDVRAVEWESFDGFYLFNPFGENRLPHDERIHDDVELSLDRHSADVAFVEAQLLRAPAGTRVATWHGFGGLLEGYACVRRAYVRGTVLECLVRM